MGLILLDTNILIDHFNGIKEASNEILAGSDVGISAITVLEVGVGLQGSEIGAFGLLISLLPITVIHSCDAIIDEAIDIRKASIAAYRSGKGRKIHAPDAIIVATANVTGRQLVTRNPADFGPATVPVRVPYKLTHGVVSDVIPPDFLA